MNEHVHHQKTLDVICQHKQDGSIIPLKIRLQDEDGEYQSYFIKSYRCHSTGNTIDPRRTPTLFFDCKIHAFGREQIVSISYCFTNGLWKVLG